MFYGHHMTFYGRHMTFYGHHAMFYGRHAAFYGVHATFYGHHSTFYGHHVHFMGATQHGKGTTQHFMGATQPFMVATLCFMGATWWLMGSMVIFILTYQHLDLYYPQFVDKNIFLILVPISHCQNWQYLGKSDTAYMHRECTSRLLGQAVYNKKLFIMAINGSQDPFYGFCVQDLG